MKVKCMAKFVRQLIGVEIKLGFIYIPAHGVELMPNKDGSIKVTLDGEQKALHYNAAHRRVFGLTGWYSKHKLKVKDSVEFSKLADDAYSLSLCQAKSETEEEGVEDAVDLSGLTSQAKGDIVEDRLKELLLLHGQGLLSVYKPVTDTEGIDLIVVKNGQFHPIFIQSKGRFTLGKGGNQLILRIKVKTFTPHENYYVIGAYFNPKTLEIDENLLLIPSEVIEKQAIKVPKSGEWYSVTASLKDTSEGKWAKYIVKKDELASVLLEKFQMIERFVK